MYEFRITFARRGTFGNLSPFIPRARNSCPIRKISVEILQYLFQLVADSLYHDFVTDESEEFMGDAFVNPAPLYKPPNKNAVAPWSSVSGVCRHWHDVAFSTPSLWSVIIIPARSVSPFFRVVTQLARSQEGPIDVLLREEGTGGRSRDLIPAFRRLFQEVHRWRSIQMWVLNDAEREILGIISKTYFSSTSQLPLTSVVVQSSSNEIYTLFGHSAPHLQTIQLYSLRIDWNQAWIASASSLTALHIHELGYSPSWAKLAIVLHASPRLRVLALELNCDMDDDMTPIRLPELQELAIRLGLEVMVEFLCRLDVPSLRKLALNSLHGWRHDYTVYGDAVTRLVETLTETTSGSSAQALFPRPHSLLTNVDFFFVSDLSCSPECVRTLYDNLNNLTTLVLDIAFEDNYEFITRLEDRDHVKLPNLKTLAINGRGYDCDAAMFCELAWERYDMGFPPKELFVRSMPFSRPSDYLSWCLANLELFYHQC